MSFIFLPLLSWYIIAQSSVTNIVTASPIISAQIDSPAGAQSQQQARELIDRLQLTPEQINQLEAIEAQYQDQIASLSRTIWQHEQELTLLLAGNATPEEIRQQQSEVTLLKQQLSDLVFNQALEIRSVFTAIQRQQIVEIYGWTL